MMDMENQNREGGGERADNNGGSVDLPVPWSSSRSGSIQIQDGAGLDLDGGNENAYGSPGGNSLCPPYVHHQTNNNSMTSAASMARGTITTVTGASATREFRNNVPLPLNPSQSSNIPGGVSTLAQQQEGVRVQLVPHGKRPLEYPSNCLYPGCGWVFVSHRRVIQHIAVFHLMEKLENVNPNEGMFIQPPPRSSDPISQAEESQIFAQLFSLTPPPEGQDQEGGEETQRQFEYELLTPPDELPPAVMEIEVPQHDHPVTQQQEDPGYKTFMDLDMGKVVKVKEEEISMDDVETEEVTEIEPFNTPPPATEEEQTAVSINHHEHLVKFEVEEELPVPVSSPFDEQRLSDSPKSVHSDASTISTDTDYTQLDLQFDLSDIQIGPPPDFFKRQNENSQE